MIWFNSSTEMSHMIAFSNMTDYFVFRLFSEAQVIYDVQKKRVVSPTAATSIFVTDIWHQFPKKWKSFKNVCTINLQLWMETAIEQLYFILTNMSLIKTVTIFIVSYCIKNC